MKQVDQESFLFERKTSTAASSMLSLMPHSGIFLKDA
jgi:hypothetical protein